MYRKLLLILMVGAFSTCVAFAAEDTPYFAKPTDYVVEGTVQYNGEDVIFERAWPFIDNNIFFVPLREVIRACGIDDTQIAWDSENKLITVKIQNDCFATTAGSLDFTVNGKTYTASEGKTRLVNGNTYISWNMLNHWASSATGNSPFKALKAGIGISKEPDGPVVIAY